jgi:hypothetical protein
MDDNICPRCNGFIPNNETPGLYPGALSRIDNETYICSACGEEEALVMLADKELWPIGQWDVPEFQSATSRSFTRIALVERIGRRRFS